MEASMDSGVDSFTQMRHFVGVVEDRNDPLQLGRVKVRIYSVHNSDETSVKLDHLPWAMVVNPITSASLSGVGRSPTGIVEGTWVFGLFLDEKEYQKPLVLGTLVGNPSEISTGKGFQDPNKRYPLDDPELSNLGESSINRHARDEKAEEHGTLIEKRLNKDALGTIVSAKGSKVPSVLPDKQDSYYTPTEWVEPHPRFGGQTPLYPGDVPQSVYPLNHVWYTEAGHLFEVDDTPSAERIHWFHKKGTFQEVQPDGSRMTKVVGSDYEVVLKDKDLYVKGNVNITVDGDVRMLVKGNKIEEVAGDYFLTVAGDYVKKIGGNEAKEILSDQTVQINGNKRERVSKNKDETTVGNFTETVKGTHKETVIGEVTMINADDTSRTVGKNYKLVTVEKAEVQSGTSQLFSADTTSTVISQGNMKVESKATQTITAPTMDIDANTGTIDYTNGSIDVTTGNITDTNVTLHTHTHNITDADPAGDNGPGPDEESDAPTSGT